MWSYLILGCHFNLYTLCKSVLLRAVLSSWTRIREFNFVNRWCFHWVSNVSPLQLFKEDWQISTYCKVNQIHLYAVNINITNLWKTVFVIIYFPNPGQWHSFHSHLCACGDVPNTDFMTLDCRNRLWNDCQQRGGTFTSVTLQLYVDINISCLVNIHLLVCLLCRTLESRETILFQAPIFQYGSRVDKQSVGAYAQCTF